MIKSYEQQLAERIEEMKKDGLVDMRIAPHEDWKPKDREEVAKAILDFMDAPTIPYSDPSFDKELF